MLLLLIATVCRGAAADLFQVGLTTVMLLLHTSAMHYPTHPPPARLLVSVSAPRYGMTRRLDRHSSSLSGEQGQPSVLFTLNNACRHADLLLRPPDDHVPTNTGVTTVQKTAQVYAVSPTCLPAWPLLPVALPTFNKQHPFLPQLIPPPPAPVWAALHPA